MNFYYQHYMVNRQCCIHSTRNIHTPPCNIIISEPPKQEYERAYDYHLEDDRRPLIREKPLAEWIAFDIVAESCGEVECTPEVEKR